MAKILVVDDEPDALELVDSDHRHVFCVVGRLAALVV
jgi:CheY-like chemotaxis protein